MQMGDIHYYGKNYGEAEKVYQGLVKEDAKDPDAWRSLALTLRAQDKHQPAAEAFAHQAENTKDEMTGYTWYTAAIEYAKAGQKEDSIRALEKATASAGHFTPDVIQSWIEHKRKNEVDAVRLRPHPYEFCLYFDA